MQCRSTSIIIPLHMCDEVVNLNRRDYLSVLLYYIVSIIKEPGRAGHSVLREWEC